MDCPICLDPLKETVRTLCDHKFCSKCVSGILKCPICRKEPCFNLSIRIKITNSSFEKEVTVNSFEDFEKEISEYLLYLFLCKTNILKRIEDTWIYSGGKWTKNINLTLEHISDHETVVDFDHKTFLQYYRYLYLENIQCLKKLKITLKDSKENYFPEFSVRGFLLKKWDTKSLIMLDSNYRLSDEIWKSRFVVIENNYGYEILPLEFHDTRFNIKMLYCDFIDPEKFSFLKNSGRYRIISITDL